MAQWHHMAPGSLVDIYSGIELIQIRWILTVTESYSRLEIFYSLKGKDDGEQSYL